MTDDRHLKKIEKRPYLRNGLTDRHEILHDAYGPQTGPAVKTLNLIKIKDGGRPPFENR